MADGKKQRSDGKWQKKEPEVWGVGQSQDLETLRSPGKQFGEEGSGQ
jgi:hypothetical protein